MIRVASGAMLVAMVLPARLVSIAHQAITWRISACTVPSAGMTARAWWTPVRLRTGHRSAVDASALDAAAMILMGLPLLAWLVGVVKLMPLAAGAHRARMAVGLPGKWRVQDHVQEHAGMDGRTTTTIPGWRVHFGVTNVNEAVTQVLRLGGEILSDVADTPWGRMAEAADPHGARFVLFQV